MKRKILSIVLLLAMIVGITGCGSNNKLNEIAKNINNSDSVKNYKEFGYIINASATNDTLTVTSKIGEDSHKVEFKLKDNVLSNENLSSDDLLSALFVINGVGQTYGYKDGELSKNINTFTNDYKKYTLDKEGLELVINENELSLKIDITKKVPLIDMDKFYLKAEDIDMISTFIDDGETGNQTGKIGNIAYDIFVGEDESSIQIGQEEKLADSAYKSILTALEVMYGEDISKHFQELYPEFVDGKNTVEAFTIETNYKVENPEESIFKDTKVVLVTIDNNNIK